MKIIPIDETIRKEVFNFFTEHWGAPMMVAKGKVHYVDKLPGFVALDEGKIVGLITYRIENGDCEIVSLDSLKENQGIGSKLVEYVVSEAKRHGCRRVWLITTNDNLKAIRFYQKQGFNMAALYLNAVEKARKLKPEIPLYGFDGIPILHEIEFEKILE
ncbi:GNAT family N-acetyltransferase [Carboxydothermus ferrireducens]|uniref:Ribosomal protein S18 acetylase RimI-like enzyme n=1 Tax=Carboxydothermus ferrireducens DSM 11255 TaxID=1119529 RepID=A0ABX2RET5_9THEO|nr:GNAT family N-acetyltransferase [Carboxydothermus ferrireducens]NYE58601.1 ribosomal protein S18 acetylase RimI-like enzyme [Carboxydothermus ferrireducens DSM 11255]